MKPDEMIGEGEHRLLETDNRVLVPVNTVVKVLVTADDVIHAWAVPAFGVKIDAVPGRANHAWFLADRTGVYYGQCSELCGVGHGFMPIAVEVVSQQRFDDWIAQQQAGLNPPPAEGDKRLALRAAAPGNGALPPQVAN
jgi:cytochrome c oxidase subunit 2